MLEASQAALYKASFHILKRLQVVPHGHDDVGAAAGEPAPAYSEGPLGWELVIS